MTRMMAACAMAACAIDETGGASVLGGQADGQAGGRGGPGGPQQGPLVGTGRYRATLGRLEGTTVTPLGPPQTFVVVPLAR